MSWKVVHWLEANFAEKIQHFLNSAHFQSLLGQLESANLGEDCFALFAAMAEAFLAANQPQTALEMAKKAAHFPAPNRKFEMARLGHLALAQCKLAQWVDAIEAMEGRLEIAVEIGRKCKFVDKFCVGDEFFQLDTHEAMSNLYATKMGNLEKAIRHKKQQFNIIEKVWENKQFTTFLSFSASINQWHFGNSEKTFGNTA